MGKLYRAVKIYLPSDIADLVYLRLKQADEMEELLREARKIIKKLSLENALWAAKKAEYGEDKRCQ